MVWVDGFPGVGVAFYLLNCDFLHVAMDFCWLPPFSTVQNN
jgi:hypothetical protein